MEDPELLEVILDTSVIIATYNGAAVLARQLRALADQRPQGFEVVVADNGSSDGTIAVAGQFRRDLDLLLVDASDTLGVSHARNIGARAARGRRYLFVDQDDEVAPGYVAAMSTALLRSPAVAARMDTTSLNSGWRALTRSVAQQSSLPIDGWAYGATLGITRMCFDRANGFDEQFEHGGEDVDLGMRLRQDGVVIEYVPSAVLRYQFPSTYRALFRQGLAYGRAHRQVVLKHGIATKRRGLATIRASAATWRLIIIGPTKARRGKGMFLLGRAIGMRGRQYDPHTV